MAIYQVVISGTVYGNVWQNRFHYATPTVGAPSGYDAGDIRDVFSDNVLPQVRALASSTGDWYYENIVVTSLYDPDDFSEIYNSHLAGLIGSSQAVPPFVSLAFRTPRLRVGRNRGYKRFCGVPESRVSGNAINGISTEVANMENALGAGLAVPSSLPVETVPPVVLFLENKGLDPNSGKPIYGFYGSETSQRSNMLQYPTWDYYRLTTQRSRIAGHGA